MPDLSSLLKAKSFGQRTYPTEAVREHFRSSLDRFEVKKSLVSKLGSHCRGLFLKNDAEAIPASDVPIGVYIFFK